MSSKKSINQKRKLLKKFGFINQDLRKNPTPQQKAAITRQWQKYGAFLSEGFAHRKIKKADKKKFQEAGFFTKGNNVFINKEGYDRVYIGRDHVTKIKGDKKSKTLLIPPSGIIDELERRLHEPHKKGVFYTVKIGDNGMFGSRVINLEELEHYIKHVFKARMTQKEKRAFKRGSQLVKKRIENRIKNDTRELISQMQIVEFNHKKMTKKQKGK